MAIVAGQITHASDIAALVGLSSRLNVDSAAVNNSTALVNSALVIALAANSVYAFDSFIGYASDATADFKWNITLPAGATMSFSNWGSDTTGAAFNSPVSHDFIVGTGSTMGAMTGTVMSCRTVGTIRTAATAGNLTYQYAQNTATVVNTFLKADSWIRATLL